ncbi:ABC transporter ATP-binding protein [Marinihelvus fidelis]|uniref:ABC-type dipeptide transporter n=1 Tax=Marinihelvus fidelis TaxID=2613842 RepID=A0A5N0T9X9_9GAMM|nr:ABC transporter ATP-binding protein [Marinihelvus fidelis]KAA9130927.1 ABC transporter ATP-binding protein [Marinihelvus fidelis]
MSTVLTVSGLAVDLPAGGTVQAVLRDVSFHLEPGRITGLAGESGSGKTTVAMALMGLLPAGAHLRSGTATLHDRDVDLLAMSEPVARTIRGRDVAMVFQDPATALDPVLTIGRQMRAVARRHGVAADPGTAAQAALAEQGFRSPSDIMGAFPHELSGGMRQLVMIAMAAMVRPAVLLADEPTTALDVTTQARVLENLRKLAQSDNIAILLVSHDLRVLAQTADELLVIRDGRIVDAGPTRQVLQSPSSDWTRQLVAAVPPDPFGRGESPTSGIPGQANDVLLSVNHLDIRYHAAGIFGGRRGPAKQAVINVSLQLRRGQAYGLAGESGSGKSSLARAIMGLAPDPGGEILFNGEQLATRPADRSPEQLRRIQVVFQDPDAALSPRRSIEQALLEPLQHFGLGAAAEQAHRVRAALADVGLEDDILPRRPRQLSSGQRQRVAIARALVCEPDLLVADEAVSALDMTTQARVLALLKHLCEERGIALMFISHDLSVVAELADTAGVMLNGHLVEQAPVNTLFTAPRHPYTRKLAAASPRLAHAGPAPEISALDGLDATPSHGCVYQHRCERATGLCTESSPEAVSGANGVRIECHFPITVPADEPSNG